MRVVDHAVHVPQEGNRIEVLAPTVGIGHPLPFLAAVVEIEHRGHGIDAQAVDVHFLQPEHGAGEQEILHLVAAEIVDQGRPVETIYENFE